MVLGVKNLPASAGDMGSIPGLGRSPGEGHGNLFQYSCLENPMNRGTWQTMGSQRVSHYWAHNHRNWFQQVFYATVAGGKKICNWLNSHVNSLQFGHGYSTWVIEHILDFNPKHSNVLYSLKLKLLKTESKLKPFLSKKAENYYMSSWCFKLYI